MLYVRIEGPLFWISALPILVIIFLYVGINMANPPVTHAVDDLIIYEPELYSNFTPVYMLAIITNKENLTRMMNLLGYWGNDFKKLSGGSIFRVGSSFAFPLFRDISIVTKHKNVRETEEHMHIFEDHLGYFLENTSLRWFIRTTEDTFAHLKRLPNFIKSMEAKYDPLTDIVMEGDVVNGTHIHGGSGWIMSRAGADWYWKNRQTIHERWYSAENRDDAISAYVCELLDRHPMRMHNSAFLGTPTDSEGIDRLVRGNFSSLPKCGEKRTSFDEVVFWHSGNKFMYTLTNGYKILNDVVDRISLTHATNSQDLFQLCV